MNSYEELQIENPNLFCPACGEVLERDAFEGGKRLTRCWHCGGMVKAVVRPKAPWAVAGQYQEQTERVSNRTRLEQVPSYAPPNLQCPFCEHVNRELPGQSNPAGLFCANCGAALQKGCLNCDRPMYVLDHFCPYCRTDQGRALYELEVDYWHQYNEAKRLARMGRWEDAHSYLRVFFDPDVAETNPKAKYARSIYLSSIAPQDGGEGLQIYNETLNHLRWQAKEELRQEQRRRMLKWVIGAFLLGLLALWSAMTFGSWWAIFVIGLGAVVLIGIIILFILISIGGM
jgi:transcription elongation factor Elf1